MYVDGLSGVVIAEDLGHSQRWKLQFDTQGGYISSFDCSQDGTRSAYIKSGPSSSGFVLAVSTAGEQKDLPMPAGIFGVSWSPDGTKIAMASYAVADDTHTIALLDPASGQSEDLVSGPGTVGIPRWSPDGTQLAYDAFGASGSRIFVFTLGQPAPIALDAVTDVFSPDWSPSANTLVYARPADDGFRQVYSVGADGSGEALVTTSMSDKGFPRWSPDGSLVAFAGTVPFRRCRRMLRSRHNLGIYTANADGTNETPFTDVAVDARLMAWCPAGPWLNQGWQQEQ